MAAKSKKIAQDFCETTVVHVRKVARARSKIKSDEELAHIGQLFKMFSDPTRLKILYALSVSELCVCDIVAALNISQSSASHQLSALRARGLVRPRRDGKTIYYSLDDDHVQQLLSLGADHAAEK